MEITKEDFNAEVLQYAGVAVIDFWAPWCGPCRMFAPILEEFAKEYEGKVKIYKVNVDEEGELAQQYGIMSIPTIMFFKNGKVEDQSSGVMSKEELKNRVDTFLK